MHDERPVAFAYEPAAQSAHAASDDDPMDGLLVPGLQGMQVLSARESPKEPAGHGRQETDEFAPGIGPNVPIPHDVHDEDELEPVRLLKVPGAHSVQLGAGWPPEL
jgi:hypothetical protein